MIQKAVVGIIIDVDTDIFAIKMVAVLLCLIDENGIYAKISLIE